MIEINEQIDELRERIGVEDWYSAHMLNYCQGQYEPGEVANATLSQSDISKNVTECAKSRATYKFDPTQIIQDALNRTGVDITLQDLQWPDDIQTGIDTLNALMAAMFVLYVIAICLIFITLITSVLGIFIGNDRSQCKVRRQVSCPYLGCYRAYAYRPPWLDCELLHRRKRS